MSIWKYETIKRKIQAANFFDLNEGDTPTEKHEVDKNNTIYLKREDKNPTGSWKDRGTAFKITELIANGKNGAVIPSSGNAAISLLTYANSVENFTVHVVVSPNISTEKKELLKALAGTTHSIHFETKAKQAASRISAELNIPILRSSQDQNLLTGYWSLGFELSQLIIHNQNKENHLFIPVSSGTALVGTVQGLMQKLEDEFKMPKIIVCQTQSCSPVYDALENIVTEKFEDSLADSIVDKSMLRLPQVQNIIKNTNGEALKITNQELLAAKDFAKTVLNEDLSFTSLLSIAGMLRYKDDVTNTNFICITSGR